MRMNMKIKYQMNMKINMNIDIINKDKYDKYEILSKSYQL